MLFNQYQQVNMTRIRPREEGYYIMVPSKTKIPEFVIIQKDDKSRLFFLDRLDRPVLLDTAPISTKWSKPIQLLPIEKL